ncbi:MAG: hypothetical protein R2706_18085 [Acidimicrobiales bacterium]
MLQLSLQLCGIALILGAVASAINGSASGIGLSVRQLVSPTLERVRERTDLDRAQLADESMKLAIAFGAAGTITNRSVTALITTLVLVKARPTIRRLTQQENPLLASVSDLSGNYVAGIYAPLVLALLLLGNFLIAASFGAVLLALLWPAKGGWKRRSRSKRFSAAT